MYIYLVYSILYVYIYMSAHIQLPLSVYILLRACQVKKS